MDEILLQQNQKVSSEKGAHENNKSDFDDRKLYQTKNMGLDGTKKNLNDLSVCFNINLKLNIILKFIMVWLIKMI